MERTQTITVEDDYTFKKYVTRYNSGVVCSTFQGSKKLDGSRVVQTVIETSNDSKLLKILSTECLIATQVKSKNHLEISYKCIRDEKIVIVARQLPTLLDFMKTEKRFTDEVVLKFLGDIIKGIKDYNIARDKVLNLVNCPHFDFKPSSIFLNGGNDVTIITGEFDFCVAYYGIKHHFDSETNAYSSPEILMGYKYTDKSDVWSVGIIAYELLTGFLPFGDKPTYEFLEKTELKFPSFVSVKMQTILRNMLTINSTRRISWLALQKEL